MIFLKYFVLSLHVLLVFTTALAPILFYKRKGKCPMKFYLSMAGTAKARKVYRLQLEAWVFLVNLTYYLLNGPGACDCQRDLLRIPVLAAALHIERFGGDRHHLGDVLSLLDNHAILHD